MSMMAALRKAFGFSHENDEDDDDFNPAAPDYAAADASPAVAKPLGSSRNESASASGAGNRQQTDSAATESPEADDSLPSDLFDAVIELFNNAQPDFVKRCLDFEQQRRYITESIDQSLKARVESAIKKSADGWESERSALEKKIAELEGGDNEIANLRQENRKLRLSVDRQKRALLDRINDLESEVARQSEEKERFYSRRQTPITEELTKSLARIKELEAEKSALEQNLASLSEEKAALEDRIRAAEDTGVGADAVKAEMQAEVDRLLAEVERQSTLREQLEVKTAMTDTMMNDLRNQAAASRQELEQLQSEQETTLVQIQEQLDGFEALKARKDAKIKELQEQNASLRRTIETNLYNQANNEMKLRSEIKELKALVDKSTPDASENAPQSETSPVRKGRRGRPKKVRIDSDLDNTDWFSTGKDDPDFGYHEPPRRPVNDNEAQLSLF